MRCHIPTLVALLTYRQSLRFSHTDTRCVAQMVESGHLDNPYHSATHVADVVQSMHCLVSPLAAETRMSVTLHITELLVL